MKFLKWFLLSLCLIFVVLVAVFYANKIQEKRILTLQNWIYTYLSDMKQMETISLDYQKDIDLWAKIIPNVVAPEIINDVDNKNIYSFSGRVSAGVDLTKLSATGVIVEKWSIVSIVLPETEILRTSVSYVPKQNIKNEDTLLDKATAQATEDMKNAATSQNITELARVNAEKQIKEDLLKKYTNVKDVVFK